ncbi:MAG: alpha-glucan family phosphorylase [Candidatus Cloacimonetes bacterium]|nr:alpha-glucan family phosphorylase [Candidatus Cloacimonadota bacterium]
MTNNHHFINIHVKPKIPDTLNRLLDLAYNIWTTWDKDAYDLFSRIDPMLYRKCEHNPVKLLSVISNSRLEELSKDAGFLYELNKVHSNFMDYLNFNDTDFLYKDKKWTVEHNKKCAYLCMEYGLHESIPIYSGGLGILAGDYLKAASDQAIPLTAFGLLYKYGYFSQKIKPDGMQEECYKEIEWDTKPVTMLKNKQGEELIISIFVEKQEIFLKVWKIEVGKINLFLLDTDIDKNPPNIRTITHLLYEADRDKRILQEIVLAYGSMKLMEIIDFKPTIYHLNEGHSAFIILELIKKYVNEEHYTFEEAKELIRNSTIFTTHTPVVEGNEHFNKKLIEKYLKNKIIEVGLTIEQFDNLASIDGDINNFWLPALAIRFSKYINGVSKLHAHVSRKMWNKIYPELFQSEVPITHITNGVHLQTWMSKQLTSIFNRYVGPEYLHASERKSVWNNVLYIPDNEIWEAHQQRKEQMISFIRNRINHIKQERGIISSLANNKQILHNKYLTIGFARRFAQYKRANLLLNNPQRLLNILTNELQPVQFIFAGKAHPADIEGKKLIKNLVDFAKQNNVEDRFIFIEDYDMNVARHIVQGCDVWLNNPIKPMEASGTSGIKAGINGVLNLSVLDGWWPECFEGNNGWAINASDFYSDFQTAQNMEAEQIYDIIEYQIAPIYYERDMSNNPLKWISMMKRSIYTVGMGFNMHRMLDEYSKKFYLSAINSSDKLIQNDNVELKKIITMKENVEKFWDKIYIKDFFLKFPDEDTVITGDIVNIEAYIFESGAPENLFTVEIFYQYDNDDHYEIIPMNAIESYSDQVVKYEAMFRIKSSGSQNINLRVKPSTVSTIYKELHYIKWRVK